MAYNLFGAKLFKPTLNQLKWNFNPYTNIFFQGDAFENVASKMPILSWPKCVLGHHIKSHDSYVSIFQWCLPM